ncbi:rop guanine nucleotide exchange factor 12-like [Dorcoceras hygrometricum]|uniref:Rop guanine nucleotide exchange factor 12-like n=1 Tax=Dorcoceras hygrometricum TaxID=472368 RepID=A0A2Z6ZXT7_9LAMI|nr:rop guanine nucleotide exchange factor 12-like [Dorcoceras hygrometricum]
MVRVLEEEREIYKSRLGYFKGMHENGGKQTTRSLIIENNDSLSPVDQDRVTSRSHPSIPLNVHQLSDQQIKIGCALNRTENITSRLSMDGSVAICIS